MLFLPPSWVAKFQYKFCLKSLRYQEFNANLGLNADTGFEVGVDGVDVSVAGFGGSIGRRVGINTPIGGFSFKLW